MENINLINTNHISTPIPTLVRLKSFTFWVSILQSPETDFNMAIRPIKVISSMLVFFPVILENEWYINSLGQTFLFEQWTHWHAFMMHLLSSRSFYWLKTDLILYFIFKSVQFFFPSFLPNFVFKIMVGQKFWSKCTDNS